MRYTDMHNEVWDLGFWLSQSHELYSENGKSKTNSRAHVFICFVLTECNVFRQTLFVLPTVD